MEFVVSVIKLFWVGVRDTTATYLKQCEYSNYGVDNIQIYVMSQLHNYKNTGYIARSQSSFVAHCAIQIGFIRRSLQHV